MGPPRYPRGRIAPLVAIPGIIRMWTPPAAFLFASVLRRRLGFQWCGRRRRRLARAHWATTRAERATTEHWAVHLLTPSATHRARATHGYRLNARSILPPSISIRPAIEPMLRFDPWLMPPAITRRLWRLLPLHIVSRGLCRKHRFELLCLFNQAEAARDQRLQRGISVVARVQRLVAGAGLFSPFAMREALGVPHTRQVSAVSCSK
jgi:hypothetical protein